MVRVTPISIVYTLLLLIVIMALTLPTLKYYANPVANTVNDSYSYANLNFTNDVYSQTYSATFNSTSGLKASGALQQFSGLAFMFGAMYQVSVASLGGIPLISTVLGSVAQYAPLPGVDVFALLGFLFVGATFLLIWFAVASWTKVEA